MSNIEGLLKSLDGLKYVFWYLSLHGDEISRTLLVFGIILAIIAILCFIKAFLLHIKGVFCGILALILCGVFFFGYNVFPSAEKSATIYCFSSVMKLKLLPGIKTDEEKRLISVATEYFETKLDKQDIDNIKTDISEEMQQNGIMLDPSEIQ